MFDKAQADNLIDKLEAGIEDMKLNTNEQNDSPAREEKIEEAEEKMDEVVERKIEDKSAVITGLADEFKENPSLIEDFRADPAKFVRDHIPGNLSAAEVEGLIEKVQEVVEGTGLFSDEALPLNLLNKDLFNK